MPNPAAFIARAWNASAAGLPPLAAGMPAKVVPFEPPAPVDSGRSAAPSSSGGGGDGGDSRNSGASNSELNATSSGGDAAAAGGSVGGAGGGGGQSESESDTAGLEGGMRPGDEEAAAVATLVNSGKVLNVVAAQLAADEIDPDTGMPAWEGQRRRRLSTTEDVFESAVEQQLQLLE